MSYVPVDLITLSIEARRQASAAVETINKFPAVLDQAVIDFALYKKGLEKNIFTLDQIQEINDWFGSFPTLWEGIRPEFEPGQSFSDNLDPIDRPKSDIQRRADNLVRMITGYGIPISQLGLATVIIAGIVVAAAFASAGGLVWALGYFKKQQNISQMIQATVSGKLSENVLIETVQNAKSNGFFGDVKQIALLALLGIGLIYVAPEAIKALRG